MAWFGRISKRGGASALIIATSAGLVITQQMGSHAVAAVASRTTVGVPKSGTAVFGSTVALTAAVSPTPSNTAGVQFLDNGAAISPVRHSTTGRYSFSTTTLGMGSHSITASFSDPSGALSPSVSAPASLTISQAGTSTATMVLTSNPGSPVQGGTPVNLTAQLTGAAGLPTPTGSITFKNGAAVITAGRGVGANGAVTVPVSTLPVGTNNISAAYSGDGNYAPQTAALVITVVPSANDKFVQHLYTDMIGSQDPGGEAFWVSKLAAGMPHSAVAFAFTQTLNYDNAVVGQLYQNVMGRGSDPGGATFWAGRMHAGMSPEQIAASMVASDERFASPSFGNGDLTTFIQATYQALLGRPADGPGLDFWRSYLAAGHPRWQLTLGFVNSTEWAHVTVTNMYAKFHLGVPAVSAWDYWAGQILGGMHDDQLAAQLTGSQQYFDWAQTH